MITIVVDIMEMLPSFEYVRPQLVNLWDQTGVLDSYRNHYLVVKYICEAICDIRNDVTIHR